MNRCRVGVRLPVIALLFAFSSTIFPQSVAASPSVDANVIRKVGKLRLAVPVERTIAGGETDVFTVGCAAGDFLHVVALQKGADIVLTLLSPDGAQLMRADSLNGSEGPEPASAICQSTGEYAVRTDVLSKDDKPGEYTIRLTELRPPTSADRDEMQAEKEFFQAVELSTAGSEGGHPIDEQKFAALLTSACDRWRSIHNVEQFLPASVLLGEAKVNLGQTQQAVQIFTQALSLIRQEKNYSLGIPLLPQIARLQYLIGSKKEALDTYAEALSLSERHSNKATESEILVDIGDVHRDNGEIEDALSFYVRSAEIAHQAGIQMQEADALGRLVAAYRQLGMIEDAHHAEVKVLELTRAGRNPMSIVTELEELASLDVERQALAEAKTALQEALSLIQHSPHSGSMRDVVLRKGYEVQAYLQLGDVAEASSQSDIALTYELAARALMHSADGDVDTSLMTHFAASDIPLAILFGKEAVNDFEMKRNFVIPELLGIGGIIASSNPAQTMIARFIKHKSSTYRTLANLLVQSGRLAEAERVLDLLKGAELKEIVRGAVNEPSTDPNPFSLTEEDSRIEGEIAAKSAGAADLTNASFEYDRLSAITSPTTADKVKLKELSDKIAAGNAAMETFFNTTLYAEMGNSATANARVNDASTETSSLMNILADLGPGVVALYTLVGEQHSYIIVTTANTRTRYEIKANAAELGKLVLAVRQQLVTPDNDPAANLTKLDHLLLDPITADIAAAAKQSKDGIPTVLWSLDGVLRYLPMNALYDGKQYFVEHARNVIITPESRNHLLDPASTTGLTAVALGLSRSYKGANPLQGVLVELDAVVHDPTVKASHGPLSGKLLANDDFTLAALEDNLLLHYPVVHVASHFAFRSGNAGESFLLLGGDQTGGPGYELTLSQLQTDPRLSFRGTRLLTLSACGTAEAGTAANGREIDSLGMVVQRRDAASVLATLWSVDDESTSLLMSEFYRRWATQSGIEKVEALRQSQMEMLHGNTFGHPYYWAPFVLIGNFR